MKRVNHDLPGVTQRLSKLVGQYEGQIQDAQQVWQDAQGRAFFQQHTANIRPVVNQLTCTLSQLIELVDQMRHQLKDPDLD